jgi:hypothetical protein
MDLGHHHHFRDSSLIIAAKGLLLYEHNRIAVQAGMQWKEKFLGGELFQQVILDYWNPASAYISTVERWNTAVQERSVFDPDLNHYGAGLGAGYTGRISSVEITVSSVVSREDGIPRFHTDSLFAFDDLQLRSGSFRMLDGPLVQNRGEISLRHLLPRNADYGVHARWRRCLGKDGRDLDFLPAPYVLGLHLRKKTATNLYLSIISNYVGPKEVRNWSEDGDVFTVPAHWEHHVSLAHTFLQGRCRLHCTALHLLGREIREHPNGNPLRFRILAGGEWRL